MARGPNYSKQAEGLLAALLGTATPWRYECELSGETGLKSGTLYPILMRLERLGWLEVRWEDEPAAGKPRRPRYRLTALTMSGAQSLRSLSRTLTRCRANDGSRRM